MIQEIDFKGLSFSPSDHESDDGEMGCMVNLLNEDGALKAITLIDGEVVGEIPSHCRIVKAHKNSGYSHWILDCVEDDVHTWKWTEMDGSEGGVFVLPEGFEPKSVSTIGNMVCFVGSDKTVYALWKDGAYVVFSLDDLDYTVEITNLNKPEREHFNLEAEFGSDFVANFSADPWSGSDEKDDDDFYTLVSKVRATKGGSMALWSALDAKMTEEIEKKDHSERWLRHITLGVAAVRLYDGSLINVSDIFMLGPLGSQETEVACNRNYQHISTATAHMDAHCHTVNVSMAKASALGDIIQGVSIFLTTGDQYLNTDKTYELSLLDIHGNPWDPSTMSDSDRAAQKSHFYGTFTWDRLTGEKLYEAIDREVFCLTKTVKPSELGTDIYLERVTGAEEAMTLSDFRRSDIGGEYSYGYNNRLHIASVRQGVGTPMAPRVLQIWPENISDASYHGMYGKRIHFNGSTNHVMMDMVFDVNGVINGDAYHHVFQVEGLHYPFDPIVSVPHSGAKTMTIYMKVKFTGGTQYYKKELTLHQSDSWGCSYYVDLGSAAEGNADNIQLMQAEYYVPGGLGQQGQWVQRPDWVSITGEEYQAMLNVENPEWPVRENVIKVSEVNNPLVFPVGNTVQVGAGKILGMASNTEPISEGQFGVAPLYAFTDEGVWALELSDNGTYRSRQPSSRDVVTDAGSITPIDKGVLFATKRGVMIIRGNQTESLTDSLNGIPWDFTTLPHHDTLLNAFDPSIVGYQRMEDFMPGSRMIYDYVRERVYLYRDDYDYALVLSLRTGLWGAAEKGGLQGGVPWYPETYILRDIDGKREIVNTSAPSDPTRKVDVLCCTRPLSLGAREIHKSVMHAVVRGLAHMRGSGEASRLGCAIYGSNDLYHWFAVNSSTNQYLRGRYGQPYKWWRIAIVGSMDEAETIDGVTMDVKARLNNRLR
jgi:hypothetical protein